MAQMLHLQNSVRVQDIEVEGQTEDDDLEPDWSLLSFEALLGILQIAVQVFTKVSSNIFTLLLY